MAAAESLTVLTHIHTHSHTMLPISWLRPTGRVLNKKTRSVFLNVGDHGWLGEFGELKLSRLGNTELNDLPIGWNTHSPATLTHPRKELGV